VRSAARVVTEVSRGRVLSILGPALLGYAWMFGAAFLTLGFAIGIVVFFVTHTSIVWLKATLQLAVPVLGAAFGVASVAVRAPVPERIMLVDDFNAAVVQLPASSSACPSSAGSSPASRAPPSPSPGSRSTRPTALPPTSSVATRPPAR
jgi:hypothetical protein